MSALMPLQVELIFCIYADGFSAANLDSYWRHVGVQCSGNFADARVWLSNNPTHLAERSKTAMPLMKLASPYVRENAPVTQSTVNVPKFSPHCLPAITGASNLLSSFSVGNAVGSMAWLQKIP
ncbi:hypothetical protein ACLFLC_21860 [Providencia rettgeri]